MRLVHFAVLAVILSASTALADRHEGYYYPLVTSRETYVARAATMPDSDRARRLAFVIGMTQEQLAQPYPPQWAIFAKGTDAEKLIIVSLSRDYLVTLYQARGMLAQLTAMARTTPFFIDSGLEDRYTFLDLLKMIGFRQLTISDGQTYAHQITIQ
ncbi:MAG: molybdopterin-guanine dinucleotide biosynthesis protein A [Rhodospirillaceae bacterium]|nr:molybdopterin-guanine dinucleotide biosynthesis protein A [Rhodospirillaceae bacterium]